MIKKYIRGNKERCKEVIAELEKLGGINKYELIGDNEASIYFIDSKNNIVGLYSQSAELGGIVMDCFEEIELPEKKQKLKVIKGDKNRGYEVIKFLENLGGFNKSCCSGKNEAFYYFIGNESCIDCYAIEDDFFNDFELEIIELPKKKTTLKVIKGNKERGDEIIKLLESMGGENLIPFPYDGTANTLYYFIDNEGYIECNAINSDFFKDYNLEIIELPEKKPTLKVIRGDESRGEEIIKLLECMGGKNASFHKCKYESNYYFINNEGCINCRHINSPFFKDYDLEVLELPEKKQEHQFKPFDKVLVRDKDDYNWICTLFSHIDNELFNQFVCGGCHWKYCIPYEGNEDLVGTSNNPKE